MVFCAEEQIMKLYDEMPTHVLAEYKAKKVNPQCFKKVQVGKDQEKAQSEKDSHSKNRGGKNQTNNQVLIP